mmetsp:Transcript_65271/g.169586  ORF Transcript_65271/g.169586 Transcript_65271/m.169586 type:complete len:363 (+) Transcript_65271:646-1734(+)
MAAALAVSDPDAELRALHALEPNRGGGGLLDAHGREARLEAAAEVMDEARLLLDGQRFSIFGAGHPAQERKQLATVANPKGERVRPLAEGLELRLQLRAQEYATRPPLRRVQRVRIAEAADEGGPAEVVKRDAALDQVAHVHVPSLEAGEVERGRHLPVTVRALLPDDRHAVLPGRGEDGVGSRLRSERELEGRCLPVLHAPLLLLDARNGALLPLQLEGCLLPDILQDRDVAVQYLLATHANDELHVRPRLADLGRGHALRVEQAPDRGEVCPADLVNQAGGFAKQEAEHTALTGRSGVELHRDSATAGEGHLQHSDDEATIGSIVACREQASSKHPLRGIEGCLQLGRVDVRALSRTHLA